MDQTRLCALRASHLLRCAIVHLAHGRVGRVAAIGVGVDVAAAIVGWRMSLGGLPANLAHMGAAACASGSGRMLLQVGLQRGRRAVAGRVRRRSDAGVVARRRRRRSRTTHTEVRGQPAALRDVLLEVGRVPWDAVGAGEIEGGRHHAVLAG
jgi:hypothetical protein